MQLIKSIPVSKNWKSVEKIEDGCSYDKKYKVVDKQGKTYLLRIAEKIKYDTKRDVFKNFVLYNSHKESVSQIVEFGDFNDAKHGYALFGWLEGEDLSKYIHALSEDKRYDIGVEAGKILKTIHQIPTLKGIDPWEQRYNRHINRAINIYKESCELDSKTTAMMDYITQNKDMIIGRPNALLHGDFHINNMILLPNQKIGIIDLDGMDYGDPWHDFNRLIYSSEYCTKFANGLIHGYFANSVPDEFFIYMRFYTYVELLYSLPKAQRKGEQVLRFVKDKMDHMLGWYDNSDVPVWYQYPIF